MLSARHLREDIRFVAGIDSKLEVSDSRLLAEFNHVIKLSKNSLYKRCMLKLFKTDEDGLSRHMAHQLGIKK